MDRFSKIATTRLWFTSRISFPHVPKVCKIAKTPFSTSTMMHMLQSCCFKKQSSVYVSVGIVQLTHSVMQNLPVDGRQTLPSPYSQERPV